MIKAEPSGARAVPTLRRGPILLAFGERGEILGEACAKEGSVVTALWLRETGPCALTEGQA